MGNTMINGWRDMGFDTVPLTSGDNTPPAREYLVLEPQGDGDRIVGFEVPDEGANWIFEVSNGDPAQTLNMDLIAGSFGQSPPEILLPPGFSKVRIPPGMAQRIAYIAGRGFFPLFAGTLVV